MTRDSSMLEIKIIYDNNSIRKGVKPAWGFSALIQYKGNRLLFDTGGKTDVLLSNMKALHISPKTVSGIFLSHNHWDHTGGLFGFLNQIHRAKVYIPVSFSQAYRYEIQSSGGECIRIKGFSKIAKDIYSSGELGKDIKEQFVIIDTPKGLIMITGCSHPGIVAMAALAKERLKKDILLIVGGFHLGEKNKKQISRLVKQLQALGVRSIAPCHCTGRTATGIFNKVFLNNCLEAGCGSQITLAE